MIVLDSNQLIANEGLQTPVISILTAIAAATGHRLAVPETVADEYLAHYERGLEELGSQVVETFRHLKALCSIWGQGMTISPPDSADETQRHRRVLESTFEVLPLASGAAGEALRREAYR